jgi:RimJ/RimL family protein N-acetyltransferase
MKLTPVDPDNEAHLRVLYDLLEERPAHANISHKKMPTWQNHCRFVANARVHGGYDDWCVIENEDGIVGAVYLTARNEIGIAILREFQRHHHGSDAIVMMMLKHGERKYLANISPANEASLKMFERLGFKTIQHTLALEPK